MLRRSARVAKSVVVVLSFGAIAVACGGSTLKAAPPEPTTTSTTPVTGRADVAAGCVADKLVVAYYLKPDGTRSAKPSRGAATVLRGDLGGQQLLVPKQF